MEKTEDPAHEIGENVTITERSQLLSITPEQAKKIKSLRIENQVIDREAYNDITSLPPIQSGCILLTAPFLRVGNGSYVNFHRFQKWVLFSAIYPTILLRNC